MWAVEQDAIREDDIEEVWAYDQVGRKFTGYVRRSGR